MQDPEVLGRSIESIFRRIHVERMRGLPLLNPALEVAAVGFRQHEGRGIGIIVTPWLMNLVMLPGADDDWSDLELGAKQWHAIGARQYKFLVNEIDDIGVCQTHSLHSPMHAFACQQDALDAARDFLARLDEEREPTAEDRVDADLLGRLMRGEITPDTGLDALETGVAEATGSTGGTERNSISRRALLRGELG